MHKMAHNGESFLYLSNSFPTQRYDIPSGSVRKKFASTLSEEFDNIRSWEWNVERVIAFQLVILKHVPLVTGAKTITRYLCRTRLLELWSVWWTYALLLLFCRSRCLTFIIIRKYDWSISQKLSQLQICSKLFKDILVMFNVSQTCVYYNLIG